MATRQDDMGPQYGSLRKALLPVKNEELQKFFCMSGMMFFVIYVYTLVRNTKDTLVISNSGAEVVTFLKVYGVLPAATIFMLLYAKLSNVFSKKALFYVTAIPFIIWYAAFAYVLYPMVNEGMLHPHKFCDDWVGSWGERWKFFIDCFRYWTFSCFYIMSELWGSVAVSILFWQFANDIIPSKQAKRFYPLFGQLANLAPICSGFCVKYFNYKPSENTPEAKNSAFLQSVQMLTIPIIISGVALLFLYFRVNVLQEREEAKVAAEAQYTLMEGGVAEAPKPKKKKPKMGMGESFKFLIQQKYLGCICVLVIAYGLSINFTEVIWKSQLKKYYPDMHQYQDFMGTYSATTGAVTFVIITIGSNIVNRLGWLVGALATPAMMLVLGAPFFLFITTMDLDHSRTILGWCVLIGTVQNILSKATKYALFDPTKEMAYIPLDEESKVKGKAAIDVLAARLGKSGGALLQQFVVVSFGSVTKGAWVVSLFFFCTVFAWIPSVVTLGGLYKKKLQEKEEEKLATGHGDLSKPLLDSKNN